MRVHCHSDRRDFGVEGLEWPVAGLLDGPLSLSDAVDARIILTDPFRSTAQRT